MAKKHTVEQIIAILRQVEVAVSNGSYGKKFSLECELKTGCDYCCASIHLTSPSYRAASPYPAKSRTNSRVVFMSPLLIIVPATHCRFCSPSRYAKTERRIRFASASLAMFTFMLGSRAEIMAQVNYPNTVQHGSPNCHSGFSAAP